MCCWSPTCSTAAAASDDVTVTVDLELPIVDIAIAAQLGCQNSTVILNATGSTPSTGIVYLWATVGKHR
ncbi:MAG: hypothetical protein IPM82_24550 [Saprospiraceae bacterium]|nr:hypothetical protein [Saprospiraceae bacterium]